MTSPSDRPAWYEAILPVMDLRYGQVVRGIAGRRDEYQPVESRYVEDSRPGTIAQLYARTFGFRDCYVADLNSICEGQVDGAALEAIAVQGLNVWLDAGVGDIERWQACQRDLPGWRPDRWIVGLESLKSWQALRELRAAIGEDRLVFSLDLKEGRPLTNRSDFREMSPLAIAETACGEGVRSLLVLDLAAVGEGAGTRVEGLVSDLSQSLPGIELISGGGIASPVNLQTTIACGVHRVLVASALHDGRIAPFHG